MEQEKEKALRKKKKALSPLARRVNIMWLGGVICLLCFVYRKLRKITMAMKSKIIADVFLYLFFYLGSFVCFLKKLEATKKAVREFRL